MGYTDYKLLLLVATILANMCLFSYAILTTSLCLVLGFRNFECRHGSVLVHEADNCELAI